MKKNKAHFARFLKQYLAQVYNLNVNDVGVMELTPPLWQIFLGLERFVVPIQPGKVDDWMEQGVWVWTQLEQLRLEPSE